MGNVNGETREPYEARMDLDTYIKSSIRAAKELQYGDGVIYKIRQADSIRRIDCILTGARKRL